MSTPEPYNPTPGGRYVVGEDGQRVPLNDAPAPVASAPAPAPAPAAPAPKTTPSKD